ncbi:MAG: helix-turn-helix transcriptional regulator [Nitrosomonas sp.]|jgi:transcriptional regulator with XRE-family HTH domain|nr:helix-turn-helix transcriptional regulator [Nitrosomonas sp.]
MHEIVQLLAVECQQPIVVMKRGIILNMAKTEEKIAFSKRLAELCEEKGLKDRGRQTALRKVCGLKQQSVNKWFNGEAVPEYENSVALCKYFNCHYEWLMTGRGEKYMEPTAIKTERDIETEEFVEVLRKLPNDDFRQVTSTGQNLAVYLISKKHENNGN